MLFLSVPVQWETFPGGEFAVIYSAVWFPGGQHLSAHPWVKALFSGLESPSVWTAPFEINVSSTCYSYFISITGLLWYMKAVLQVSVFTPHTHTHLSSHHYPNSSSCRAAHSLGDGSVVSLQHRPLSGYRVSNAVWTGWSGQVSVSKPTLDRILSSAM